VLGTGAKAHAYAAGADAIGLAVGRSYPARLVKQLFNARSMGQASHEGQVIGGGIYDAKAALKPEARRSVSHAAIALQGLEGEFSSMFGNMPDMMAATPAEQLAKRSDTMQRFARFYSEGNYTKDRIGEAAEDFFNMPAGSMTGKISQEFTDNLDNVTNAIVYDVDTSRSKVMEYGVDKGQVDPVMNSRYVSRHVNTNPGVDAIVYAKQKPSLLFSPLAPMSHEGMRPRNPNLENLPAEIIERVFAMTHGKGGSLTNQRYAIAIDSALRDPLNVASVRDQLRRLGMSDAPEKVAEKVVEIAKQRLESDAAQQVAARYGKWFNDLEAMPKQADGITPLHSSPARWAEEVITKTFEGLQPSARQRVKSGGRLYDNYLDSFERYLAGSNNVQASAKSILEAFGTVAKKASDLGAVDLERGIGEKAKEILAQKIKNIETTRPNVPITTDEMLELTRAARNEALSSTHSHEFLPDAIKRAGFTLPENAKDYIFKRRGGAIEDLDTLVVPTAYVDAAKSLLGVSTSDRSASLLRALVEGGTKVIKENLTLPFLSFFSRNFVGSTLFMNYMSGEIDSLEDVVNMAKSIHKVRQMQKDPAKYAKDLEQFYIHGLTHYGYVSRGIPAQRIMSESQFLPPSPLNFNATLNEARATPPITLFEDKPEVVRLASDYLEGALDKKSFEAGKKAIESGMSVFERARAKLRVGHQFALRTGEKANAQAELFARGGLFNFLVDYKGYTPAEAARRVRQVHVDYSDLAPFEKDYLRTLFPFYTFARKQMTETLGNIAQHPGGAIASTIKGMNRLRDPNGLTPDYVAETASIPLGEDAEGNKDYLTGFGLAFEDPLSFFGKGIRGAGLETLSRMNPLVKGPLEYFTGQTFFQSTPEGGRPMYDADPVLGRFISNITGDERPYRVPGGQLTESLISNSPLSRYLTTARTLTDTRKDPISKLINAATGVRIATISPQASEAILRERAQSALRDSGGKAFVRAYVPDYVKAGMSPQELQEAADLEALLNTLAERARKRKKQKAAANS